MIQKHCFECGTALIEKELGRPMTLLVKAAIPKKL